MKVKAFCFKSERFEIKIFAQFGPKIGVMTFFSSHILLSPYRLVVAIAVFSLIQI